MMWGMVVSPGAAMFVLMSTVGTLMVLFSSGLLGMWICLEVGFFGFIPLLNGKTVGENESCVKYFVVQSVGSGLLLFSFLIIAGDYLSMVMGAGWGLMGDFMMVLGFMVKLGVFPMHFWFPSVMGSASWFSCFWLSVVQKLGPFWAFGGLGFSSTSLFVLILALISTSVVGAFGGLAQVQFRPLLAYSSLGQTGWLGLVVLLNTQIFILYIGLYSAILVGLLWGLNMLSAYDLVSVPGWSSGKGLYFWMFGCSFFISLSGLPPLAGSAMKMVGVLLLAGYYPVFLGVLIFTSMVSLYYYLTMFISGVVYVGGSGFSSLDSIVTKDGMSVALLLLVGLNWLGGFPLFLLTATATF